MEKKFQDRDLGIVTIRSSSRAGKYSIRVRDGKVFATMPVRGNMQTLVKFINEQREKLKEILQKPSSKKNIDQNTELQTNTFKLNIFCTERADFYMRLNEGILNIACPKETNFDSESVQTLLKTFLLRALKHEAKRILPERLQSLAKQFGFTYSGLRIANTRSRWGSCSSKRNINLSVSLMLLPDHLINYVILHELCHTIEMNHSERFWLQMNRVTNNLALSLRKELKGYNTFV